MAANKYLPCAWDGGYCNEPALFYTVTSHISPFESSDTKRMHFYCLRHYLLEIGEVAKGLDSGERRWHNEDERLYLVDFGNLRQLQRRLEKRRAQSDSTRS